MATCYQFTTEQLKALTFKLQCCLGQSAKMYARLRAAGRYDLAKCKQADIKYLTLAYNALNCVDSFDKTVKIISATSLPGKIKTVSFGTLTNHNLQVGNLMQVLGFNISGLNVTSVPILSISALNEFTLYAPDVTSAVAQDLGLNSGVTATTVIENSISCDDIQSILDKVKTICDCDCCLNDGENRYKLSYNAATDQLSTTLL